MCINHRNGIFFLFFFLLETCGDRCKPLCLFFNLNFFNKLLVWRSSAIQGSYCIMIELTFINLVKTKNLTMVCFCERERGREREREMGSDGTFAFLPFQPSLVRFLSLRQTATCWMYRTVSGDCYLTVKSACSISKCKLSVYLLII